jgi:hypothetical protein
VQQRCATRILNKKRKTESKKTEDLPEEQEDDHLR